MLKQTILDEKQCPFFNKEKNLGKQSKWFCGLVKWLHKADLKYKIYIFDVE